MLKVAILGATGYTGRELIKILLNHPEAQIVYLGTRREDRPQISQIHPELTGRIEAACEKLDMELVAGRTDFVFSCLPHTASMDFVPQCLDAGLKVVDISADYRLRDAQIYEKWYEAEHTDIQHLAESVYGLPELFADDITKARLVANPGCYPTGAILGLAPLVSRGLIELENIIIDAKSGISGAGRTPSPTLHFPECNESVAAYNVGVHRHTPEMDQILSQLAEKEISVTFVPHIVPMDRGILSTIYVHLAKEISQGEVEELFADFYKEAPFVLLRKDDLPATKDVWGTNFCHLALRSFGRKAVIISAIDNLIKGASGQAVENMNLMAGFERTEGLL